MIRLGPAARAAVGIEAFALDMLIDESRLLRVDDPTLDVVELELVESSDTQSLAAAIRGEWQFEPADGRVFVTGALLRFVGNIAAAVDEQVSTDTDKHGRVPSVVNPLVKSAAERDPIVSRAAIALRRTVKAAADRRPVRLLQPWPNGRRWAAALTHDLDVVEWWPAFTALRIVEMLRTGDLGSIGPTLSSALRAGRHAPAVEGVRMLLELEAARDVRSTWFVLCGTPSFGTMRRGDLTYRPESLLTRRILSLLRDAAHEIGLHGSFATMASSERFVGERERLRALTGAEVRGVRQHFLRMRPGLTQRAMEASGFEYDATFGFPDRNGFRLGVADIVQRWDAQRGERGTIAEVPLTWMDRALSKYAHVNDPERWIDDALSLAATARDVEGLWVGLWHPNLVPALGYPGAPAAFERLISSLLAERPFVGTLSEVVVWRACRRAARGTGVDAAGEIRLSTPESRPWPVSLEYY